MKLKVKGKSKKGKQTGTKTDVEMEKWEQETKGLDSGSYFCLLPFYFLLAGWLEARLLNPWRPSA
jgi:hypothetical protein